MLGFDAASFEIGSLLNGAQLVIIPRRISSEPRELAAELRRRDISVLLLTTALFELMAAWDGGIFGGLRRLLVGGDVVNPQWMRRVLLSGRAPEQILHVYGPTECSTVATTFVVAEVAEDAARLPIGWPISSTTAYVLDSKRKPVPVGTPGELCLGGPRLAKGYLNRPELTREKFVQLSLENGRSERIYRTGDLVRSLPDGSIEFIGRIDRQMKIRGYRVEPAEIESRLNAHPAIAASVVMARRDLSGQASLVAFFIVGEGQPALSSAGLSAYLAVTLPDYMIPSAFVQKSEWPLSAHGKVDRDALLESLRTEHREEETAASNDSERALRELCRKVIGTSSIGLDESLIAYGLHSLSAANLAWMIEEKFQVRVRLSEILEKPSFGGLLALVEGKKHTDANGTDPRLEVRTVRPRAIPLSFPQEQIWFLEKLHPHLNSYRFQSLLHFRGALDVGVLEATLNRMVSRHEILRTVFLSEEEFPRQEIRPHVPFRLIPEDLRGMAEGVRQRELDRLIREELRRPFDLKAGPLIRWRLFQWDDNAFELLHTEHHFLHDGWGYGVFLAELYATYKALSGKKDVALSHALIQFADFALWQRDAMASGAWDHQLAFWQKELAGCPVPPTLPSDRLIGVPRTFAGSQIRRPFPQALWDELGSVCSREGVTRFAWIHAAFQLFVHRYTGAEDFCVGSGFANRRDPRLQKMLGMVINTLPIRARFAGVTTFRDLARRASQALRSASDNQELPFERVVQEMNPHRDANANPFFNTCIGAYEDAFPHFQTDRLEITSDDAIACGQVKFDLMALLIPPKHGSVDFARSAAPLVLWEFSTELFDVSAGERMLDHFLHLVESCVREPDGAVEGLSMMSERERNQVLAFGRGPVSPPECRKPVHRLFEDLAAVVPDDCAVVVGEEHLSYGELNLRANRLAKRLMARGCSPGSIVGVALPRGLDAIISFLAVLKAGGAYLPIDLREPADRIARLIELANARLVLTRSNASSKLPRLSGGAEVLVVDEPFVAREGDPLPDVSSDSAAYVLFTSGSSGIPKAVLVPHRAILRLVFGLSTISLGKSEVLLHFAPLNFDASTFEIWGALLQGAKLVIHSDEFADLNALGDTLGTHGVTTAWLTSSLFNQIIDTCPAVLRGVRQVITGGEALSPGHIARAHQLLPNARFFNGYGPTETTTFATIYPIPNGFSSAEASVPIGRPIAGTQTLVLAGYLEGAGRLAPMGVPGELYIGGDGVALGYLDRAELTAERFVRDPEGLFPGAFYRTGDLVRWRSDGNLEFMGRIDSQVKIRGYRIEPGEIETTLKGHPDVEEAAVAVWEDKAGERRLVGYVVSRSGKIVEEWRPYLQQKLPSYMVPSAIVRLPSLPLTASGKLDRKALPEPERNATGPVVDAELTPSEEMVASVWSEVLGLKEVSPHDNFFELGGHSLLATRVISRLRASFGIEVPLRAVFDNPTVSELGEFIASARGAAQNKPSQSKSDALREEALF